MQSLLRSILYISFLLLSALFAFSVARFVWRPMENENQAMTLCISGYLAARVSGFADGETVCACH